MVMAPEGKSAELMEVGFEFIPLIRPIDSGGKSCKSSRCPFSSDTVTDDLVIVVTLPERIDGEFELS